MIWLVCGDAYWSSPLIRCLKINWLLTSSHKVGQHFSISSCLLLRDALWSGQYMLNDTGSVSWSDCWLAGHYVHNAVGKWLLMLLIPVHVTAAKFWSFCWMLFEHLTPETWYYSNMLLLYNFREKFSGMKYRH